MINQVTVTYFTNSGFMVKADKVLFIFDYWRGEENALPENAQITPKDFEGFERIIVFVSHAHKDHYDDIIYTWDAEKYNITYVISDELPKEAKGVRVKPGDVLEAPKMVVKAYPSTDTGVSFLIKYDKFNIFHAGDLNWWHWREETSSVAEINRAETEFMEACAKIEKETIHLCFFPLDPRLGIYFDSGINYFSMVFKPKVVIPMHWGRRVDILREYAYTSHSTHTEVLPLFKPRERADITMLKGQLNNIYVHNASVGANPKEETPEPTEETKDPFMDSDLPVDIKE